MRTYALAPSTIRGLLRRSQLRLQLVVTLSFLAFGIFLVMQEKPLNWPPVIAIVAVIALAYFLILFEHYRRMLRALYAVRVEISSSLITLRQAGLPAQTAVRADVIDVQVRGESIVVLTLDGRGWVEIPTGLAGRGDEDVRDTLALWLGIERLPEFFKSNGRAVFWISVAAGLVILMFANSLLVAVPLGLFLFFFGMHVERRLWQNQVVGVSTARTYSLAFSFLIFVIVMKSCLLAAYTLYR